MSDPKTNENIGLKRTESRYIMINEDIFDALSKHEFLVYMALRYEADYSKETSIVKKSIRWLVDKSKIGRRNVFEALNSLEHTHFLIQRIQMPITGIQNNYNVSRTLDFFNPANTSAPIAFDAKKSTYSGVPSAPIALGSAIGALGSAPIALPIINSSVINTKDIYIGDSQKPETPKTPTPVISEDHPTNHYICKYTFREFWIDLDVTIEDAYKACKSYWDTKKQIVTWVIFNNYLKHPKSIQSFEKIKQKPSKTKAVPKFTEHEQDLAGRYRQAKNDGLIEVWFKDENKREQARIAFDLVYT